MTHQICNEYSEDFHLETHTYHGGNSKVTQNS